MREKKEEKETKMERDITRESERDAKPQFLSGNEIFISAIFRENLTKSYFIRCDALLTSEAKPEIRQKCFHTFWVIFGSKNIL